MGRLESFGHLASQGVVVVDDGCLVDGAGQVDVREAASSNGRRLNEETDIQNSQGYSWM